MNTRFATQEPSRSLVYRGVVFAYGVVAYAVGVAALLAVILFMLGVVRFTGGPLGELGLGAGLSVDVLLLILFAFQHSVMARPSFKARWTSIVPVAAERSTYLLATGLVLAPLLLMWQPMPAVVWSVEAPVLRASLFVIALLGWAYLFAASFAINHFELFGLQQVYQVLRQRPLTQAPFRERWMYRFDRHPIMTGGLDRHLGHPDDDRGPPRVCDRLHPLCLDWCLFRRTLASAAVGVSVRQIPRTRVLKRHHSKFLL